MAVNKNNIEEIAIIGCGQVGTSIIAALRQQGNDSPIHVYDVSPTCEQELRERFEALNLPVGDLSFHDSPSDAARNGDLVILATPMDAFADTVGQIKTSMKPNAILTDVGSAKRKAIATINEALQGTDIAYVPAHPGNGSSGSGPASGAFGNILGANSWMFIIPKDDANPAPEGSPEATVQKFWADNGVQTAFADAHTHDRFFGTCSHFQHHLVFSMMSLPKEETTPLFDAFMNAGTGLRNVTRVAKTTPEMWLPITNQNQDAILAAHNNFMVHYNKIDDAVQRGDKTALTSILSESQGFRLKIKDSETRESIIGEISDQTNYKDGVGGFDGMARKARNFFKTSVALPYVVAVCQTLNAKDVDADLVTGKANPSFRDGSAMALNDPANMAKLLLENREDTLAILSEFKSHLDRQMEAVAKNDQTYLRQSIENAKDLREKMPPPRRSGFESVREGFVLTV